MTRPKTIRLSFEGEPHAVEVSRDEHGFYVRGDSMTAELGATGRGGWSVLTSGRSVEAQVTRLDDELLVDVGGERFVFSLEQAGNAAAAGRTVTGRAEVKAPMPGKVAKLLAGEGDNVEAGQGVLLFEAMKMQNEIRSPRAGVLSSVAVREGDAVEAREILFIVTPV